MVDHRKDPKQKKDNKPAHGPDRMEKQANADEDSQVTGESESVQPLPGKRLLPSRDENQLGAGLHPGYLC